MSLPPYSTGVYWKNYEIDTPTFKLSPVEKPDMSPFLFHMTGRDKLFSILSGNGSSEAGIRGHGFLQAFIPEAHNAKYHAQVVCFTESPTFALDFFRYRSYRRWMDDQLFGIGFDKSALVKLGARPCVYAGEELKSDILFLRSFLQDSSINDRVLAERLKTLIENIYSLTTPLLENEDSQGFMWEREWRYSNSENSGLIFCHDAIRIICCPESEESDIKKALSRGARDIQFVRSWSEYNEVSSYLKKRQENLHIPQEAGYCDDKEFLDVLLEQLNNHKALLCKVSAYDEYVSAVAKKKASIEAGISDIEASIYNLERKIERVRNKS